MAYKRKFRSFRKSRRSRRGKFSRRRGRRSFSSRVKKVLMKTSETKYHDIAFENRQLYHNLGSEPNPPGVVIPVNVTSSPDWINPWVNITQGTARNQRIGDKINPVGMRLKIYLANKFDRVNTMYRLIVAILPKLVGTTVTSNVFDPFQIANAGVTGNNMLLPSDKDLGVKFLYDRIHRISAQSKDVVGAGTGKEVTKIIKLWIKRKRAQSIVFSGPLIGSTIVNKPLAIYCIPYEQYSTLTTDRVGSWSGHMRMYYKDI